MNAVPSTDAAAAPAATPPAARREPLLETARLCRALAAPLRLRIVELLRAGELPSTELARLTGARQSNLSLHINILYRAGVLARRRSKAGFCWSLATGRAAQACERLSAAVLAEASRMAGHPRGPP